MPKLPLVVTFHSFSLFTPVSSNTQTSQNILTAVAHIHGNPGPFAVAGHKIADHALAQWGLTRGSWDIAVTHYSPAEVQYSCAADGLQAGAGVRAGMLNLKIEPAPIAEFRTVITNKKTKEQLTYKLTPAFLQEFLNIPHPQSAKAGEWVASMNVRAIFSVEKGSSQ